MDRQVGERHPDHPSNHGRHFSLIARKPQTADDVAAGCAGRVMACSSRRKLRLPISFRMSSKRFIASIAQSQICGAPMEPSTLILERSITPALPMRAASFRARNLSGAISSAPSMHPLAAKKPIALSRRLMGTTRAAARPRASITEAMGRHFANDAREVEAEGPKLSERHFDAGAQRDYWLSAVREFEAVLAERSRTE